MSKRELPSPTPEQQLDLLQAAYDAAGTATGWNEFLEAYVQAFGAAGVWLGHQFLDTTVPLITGAARWDPHWIRAFHDHFGAISPYRGLLKTKTVGRVYHVHEVVPKTTVLKSEFYADFVVPNQRSLGGLMMRLFDHPGGAEVSGLAVHFDLGWDDATIAAAISHHQRLVPHIQSAVRLHYELLSLRSLTGDLNDALETTGTAVVVCDHHGGVRFVNTAAERVLARRDGLGIHAGRLAAQHCRGGRSLHRATAETAALAARRSQAVHTALRVERSNQGQDYELLFFPMPERHDSLRQRGGRVLVFIHDPDARVASLRQLLCALYALTPREAELVGLLLRGHTSSAIAEELEVSRETVKTHLKAAFSKTETRSQSQLVAKVLSGVGRYLREPAE
jgi:DNA-binding CsgD family transcriptional regulator/PAS domain-containing protein